MSGQIVAIVGRVSLPNRNRCVYTPGSMRTPHLVALSSWGHAVLKGGPSVGQGVIEEVGDALVLRARFSIETPAGRKALALVRRLGRNCRWSIGADIHASHDALVRQLNCNVVTDWEPTEASPVSYPACTATATLEIEGEPV